MSSATRATATASVRVDAESWIDNMQPAQVERRIVNVLWEMRG